MTESFNGKQNTKWFIPAVLLTLLVLTGLGIRLINLGKPGFGTDESFQAVAAKSILENGKPDLPNGTPYLRALLYTKLVAFSFSIFGTNEFAARLPSAVFGTFSIILIFFVGKRLFGTTVGAISAILLAFSPFEVAWSRECRMYAMFQFFFLFGFFAFYSGFENHSVNEKRNIPSSFSKYLSLKSVVFDKWQLNWNWLIFSAILFGISASLQMLTVFFGLSVVIYCFIMGMLILFQENLRDFLKSKYFFVLLLTILGSIVILLAVPSLFKLAKGLLFFSPGWARNRNYQPLVYTKFLSSAPVFPIGVFFLMGSIQLLIRKHKSGFYTLICSAVPLITISLFYSNLRDPRYIFNIFALIILISSYSIDLFIQSESAILSNLIQSINLSRYKTFGSKVLISIFLLVFSTSFVTYGYRVIIDYYGKEGHLAMTHRGWREVRNYVAKYSKPSDIVITPEPITAYFYDFKNISYLLDKSNSDANPTNLKPIPNLQTFKKILSNNPRGWIITDPDRFYSPFRTAKDVSEFVEKHLIHHPTKPNTRLLLFSWDQKYIPHKISKTGNARDNLPMKKPGSKEIEKDDQHNPY